MFTDSDILAATLRMTTPLLLAALGGLWSERAGIVNIGLEGIMLFGAFSAAAVAHVTGNPLLGLLSALFAGAGVSGLHGLVTIRYHGNQIISGVGLILLGMAVPPTLCGALFGTPSSTPPLLSALPHLSIPGVSTLPVIGPGVFNQSYVVYAALVSVPLTAWIFRHTVFGLRLRSVGENPWAAAAQGVRVERYRWYGVLLCGLLAGLAGAFLSIEHGSQFIKGLTAGRGFIALAALIFGNWKPGGILLACLLFGGADALQMRMQGTGLASPYIVQILPYIVTMLVLAGVGRRAQPPAAAGQSFRRE